MESTLKLFDTMEDGKSRSALWFLGSVTMFVCGPTVQSRIHLGHARTYIFYDVPGQVPCIAASRSSS